MDQTPQWRVREMQPGEINIDPFEGEFFTTEAIDTITDALVRESIQNSLDAAASNEPVTVRFSFHSRPNFRSDPKLLIQAYLNGLSNHLNAKNAGLQDLPSPSEGLSYILIEDFGTRGLQGDEHQYDDLDDDTKRNDFYYFWRNIGRTRKGDTDLGRWGLGKTVFQAASRINSFFGLTIRRDDSRALLMGQSVLKIHKLNGLRYAPYGYYGEFNKELALPVENQDYIKSFCEHFMIGRQNQPGLSILIPYPDQDIFSRDCLNSAIKHYFFPILAGKLVVEMQEANKRYKLDATTLDEYLKNSKWAEKTGMPGLVALARWAIRQPESVFVHAKEPMPGKAPKLRDDLFDPEQLKSVRLQFSEGTRLAFRIPISLQRKFDSNIMHSSFSVFLERDPNLDKAEDHFIRQGITIPEVSSLKHKGIRAIVSINERDLSAFLGDAENPAHTEWERNSKKFKSKYRLGPSTLDFVKSSPREIVKILTQPQKGRDENLLKHLFALPASPTQLPGKEDKKDKGQGENKESDGTFVGVEGAHYLQLNPIRDGFSLMRKAKSTKVPRYITVMVAYEVRSGNPFKKYTPLDFELSKKPIQVQLDGGKILFCKENTIHIEVTRGNFKLAVVGFDRHRDLRVKTNP
jgi:hypothetical protein